MTVFTAEAFSFSDHRDHVAITAITAIAAPVPNGTSQGSPTRPHFGALGLKLYPGMEIPGMKMDKGPPFLTP
jgi:hypothetical protein